jgi:hypothetical protein
LKKIKKYVAKYGYCISSILSAILITNGAVFILMCVLCNGLANTVVYKVAVVAITFIASFGEVYTLLVFFGNKKKEATAQVQADKRNAELALDNRELKSKVAELEKQIQILRKE